MRTFSTVELTGRSQRYKPRERALRIPRVNKATTTRFPAEGGTVLVETTGGVGGTSTGAVTEAGAAGSAISAPEFASLVSGSGLNAPPTTGASTGSGFLTHPSRPP